ncbi:MAG: sialidase family protein, partial [bacterium]
MYARTSSLALLALIAAAGCSPDPVQWTDDRSVALPAAASVLSANGDLVTDTLAALASRVVLPASVCAGSLRLSSAKGTLYAAWWSPRPDSGARLLSAHSSDDGATWSAIAPVDTMDRGVSGCRRAAPSIAADSTSGYVHITYGMVAPEGPGLFFSHSMDGGASFHAPVPILYGERLGVTSVAAAGDHVAVAFEDPNSGIPRIGLALSRTMGHIFEDRLLP